MRIYREDNKIRTAYHKNTQGTVWSVHTINNVPGVNIGMLQKVMTRSMDAWSSQMAGGEEVKNSA